MLIIIQGGNTALLDGVYNGHLSIAEILVAAGANKDAHNEDGFTALMFAADNSEQSILELLLAAGASTDMQDRRGETALIKV